MVRMSGKDDAIVHILGVHDDKEREEWMEVLYSWKCREKLCEVDEKICNRSKGSKWVDFKQRPSLKQSCPMLRRM